MASDVCPLCGSFAEDTLHALFCFDVAHQTLLCCGVDTSSYQTHKWGSSDLIFPLAGSLKSGLQELATVGFMAGLVQL